MEKIFGNLHLIVLLFIGMGIYSTFSEHQERMDTATTELNTEKERLDKKQKDLKNLEAYNKDIEKAKEDLELARAAIEKMQRQLPSEVSNTENLEILQGIATALNIKNIALTPGIEEDRGFYLAKEYGLKASGTFLQFLIFFERLAREQRLFNVKFVNLFTGNHRQKGRFQIIDAEIKIEAFRYNTNYKESTGIEEIEKETQAADKPVKRKKRAKKVEEE